MNRVLIPKIAFKDIVSDERRIKTAYARIFEIARRNILVKRLLTNSMLQKYTGVQNEKGILNNRGSSQALKS